MRLFGCLFDLDRERLGAGPGMLGDIEEDALGTAELDLEAADPVPALVHVMLAAQALELPCDLLDILDQDAEMMQAGVVEALADLVGLEP